MTNKLEHLRELVRRADSSEHYWQQQASAMEFAAHGNWLLDRLEKLEAQIGGFQEESLYYMAQNAKMQAVVEAADECVLSLIQAEALVPIGSPVQELCIALSALGKEG